MLKNAIWDFDGTLYDTYPKIQQALTQTLTEIGVKFDAGELYRYIKLKSVHDAIANYATQHQLVFAEVLAHYMKIEHQLQQDPKPFTQTRTTLEAVKAVGGRNFLMTHRDRGAFKYLQQDGLYELFDGFVTSDDGYARKPDPEAILAIIQQYHLDPDETAMIGDRKLDVIAGENAGVVGIYFDIDHFADAPMADVQVQQLSEIVPYFK